MIGKRSKGTLVGRKQTKAANQATPLKPANNNIASAPWRRVAAVAALFGAGWLGAELSEGLTPPAYAASIVEEARDAHAASAARQKMASQPESIWLDRVEIADATGLSLPALPVGWAPSDVQLYPSDFGNTIMIALVTETDEAVWLFAALAETPAEDAPLIDDQQGASVAYWEEEEMAFALMGEVEADRLMELAANLSATGSETKNLAARESNF